MDCQAMALTARWLFFLSFELFNRPGAPTAESKDRSAFSNSKIFSSVGGTEAQMEASQE